MATLDDSPSTYDSPTSSSPPTLSADLPPSIDPSTLPSGLPFLGPLSGYTTHRRNQLINSQLARFTDTISRPLTTPETVCIADQTARGYALMSYGPTLGFLAAGYRTYATRHEYRWPFLGPMISTPKEKRWGGFWDGERMRLNDGKTEVGMGVGVEGRRVLMHLVRGSAYAAMGVFVGGLLFGTYGLTVTAVGEANDERFNGIRKIMREQINEQRRERERRSGELVGQKGRMPGRGRGSDQEREEEVVGLGGGAAGFEPQQPQPQGGGDRIYGQGGRETGDLWSRHREKIQRGAGRGQPDADDASPTSGMGMLDFGEGEDMRPGNPEADDSSMRSGSPSSRRSRRRMDGQQDRNRDAPSGAGRESDSTVGDGLSAWERIRRGADSAGPSDTGVAPSPSPMRTDGRRPPRVVRGQNGDDDFTFSSSDQERSYAQSEAQDEFDKRLEQERRGGDFSESGQSGWSGRRG